MIREIPCPHCGGKEAYTIANNFYWQKHWIKRAWWHVITYLHIGYEPNLWRWAVCCPDCGRQGAWADAVGKAVEVWQTKR